MRNKNTFDEQEKAIEWMDSIEQIRHIAKQKSQGAQARFYTNDDDLRIARIQENPLPTRPVVDPESLEMLRSEIEKYFVQIYVRIKTLEKELQDVRLTPWSKDRDVRELALDSLLKFLQDTSDDSLFSSQPSLSNELKPSWNLSTPERFSGYREPLYNFLKQELDLGHAKPTAYDVISAWSVKKPAEVIEVNSRGITYLSAGSTASRRADVKAISQAIKGLIIVD